MLESVLIHSLAQFLFIDIFMALNITQNSARAEDHLTYSVKAKMKSPSLSQKIPPHPVGEIIIIQARDHYYIGSITVTFDLINAKTLM